CAYSFSWSPERRATPRSSHFSASCLDLMPEVSRESMSRNRNDRPSSIRKGLANRLARDMRWPFERESVNPDERDADSAGNDGRQHGERMLRGDARRPRGDDADGGAENDITQIVTVHLDALRGDVRGKRVGGESRLPPELLEDSRSREGDARVAGWK